MAKDKVFWNGIYEEIKKQTKTGGELQIEPLKPSEEIKAAMLKYKQEDNLRSKRKLISSSSHD